MAAAGRSPSSRWSTTICRFCSIRSLAELAEQGHEPRLLAHSALAVEWSAAGGLLRCLGEATAASGNRARRESLIHLHVDRIEGPEARARLIAGLSRVYADVAVTAGDRDGMRARVEQIAAAYRAHPPPLASEEIAEALAFLGWIADGHFIFLGLREYRFPDGDMAADPVAGSGLGLLRDPDVRVLRRGRDLVVMTPEIRAFLGKPEALIIAKANVRSRVHRRVHLDYVGVKLFSASGRLEGELRLIGLFTAGAYTGPARAVPFLRLKVDRVLARASLDPASHAGRALEAVLETYPRDELFQVYEDTLYRFAVEIMNVSERPRICALARSDEFDRFTSVLVFIRRTATTPPSAGASARCSPNSTRVAFRRPNPPTRRGPSRGPISSSAATNPPRLMSIAGRSKHASPRSRGHGATRFANR